MLNFCTLFDVNYLTRGLTMYRSLEAVCPSFHLYVFAFDEHTLLFLGNNKDNYPNLTVISLEAFEDTALLGVKQSRSTAEYCWTCTPSTILYCINTFQLQHCTYIDADMFFYNNPQVLIDEMGDKSVLISEHRYTKTYDQSAYSGIYCVQFMCFKNTTAGMRVLNWWRSRCIEWCYARSEDGKFGDQKYLDDWTTRFEGIHVLQHRGGGIAPWNVQQYQLANDGLLKEIQNGNMFEPVFFHFHGLTFYTDNKVSFCGTLYEITDDIAQRFYLPYIHSLLETGRAVKSKGLIKNATGAKIPAPSKTMLYIQFMKQTAALIKKGRLPVFGFKYFNFSKHYHVHSI